MTPRRYVIILFMTAICLLGAAKAGEAQGTNTGAVSPDANKYYSFTPAESGQLIATLSWDNQASNLVLVLVCGTSDPIVFGAASGQLDRFARLESGVLGLIPCLIGVATLDTGAAYRLNLQRSTDQLATAQVATLRGVTPSAEDTLDARLVEYAARTLAALKMQVR